MIYFILLMLPFIITVIFFMLYPVKYEIITKEIQPNGEYFLLISKTKYDEIKYKNFNVSCETFNKFSRGKITGTEYKEIERSENFDCK